MLTTPGFTLTFQAEILATVTISSDGTMSSPVTVPEHERSRLIYSKNTNNILDAFDAFPVEGNYTEYSDETGCTDKWANAHGMPFRTQVERFCHGLLQVRNKTRARIFKSLVQGNYSVWRPANEKKTFVVFGRSGKCINGNGTNISDGSDIEDWIVDVARVKVEESYKEYAFSDSSDDNDSDIVRTTSDIGK